MTKNHPPISFIVSDLPLSLLFTTKLKNIHELIYKYKQFNGRNFENVTIKFK